MIFVILAGFGVSMMAIKVYFDYVDNITYRDITDKLNEFDEYSKLQPRHTDIPQSGYRHHYHYVR